MSITLEERPVFVLGCHRSGTTMLMLMIGSHPRIAVPEVAWYYQRFRPYLHTYGDLGSDENFRTLAEEMIFTLVPPFLGMKANPATILDEILGDLRDRSFAGIFCAMLERHARQNGKPRWAEKSPNNGFFIGQVVEDFPNAQFIYLTRDGRDNVAETIHSRFGSYNAFCSAERWKLFINAAKPWREKLSADQWLDLNYETLVREPEAELRRVCEFLGEDYSPSMLEFHKSDIARNRSQNIGNPGGIAHAPLGTPVTDKFVGVYRELLSIKDQQIFAAVAGKEQLEAGYDLDYDAIEISEEAAATYREIDDRVRAALMVAPGHFRDSYIEWLIDRREERRRQGIWSDADAPDIYPIGDFHEEMIMGKGASREWKTAFGIPRRYY